MGGNNGVIRTLLGTKSGRKICVFLTAFITVGGILSLQAPSYSATTTTTLASSADTYVTNLFGGKFNFGHEKAMGLGAYRYVTARPLLAFSNVPAGPFASAYLKLHATNNGPGFDVYKSKPFNEYTVNWQNQPALGVKIGSTGPVKKGTDVKIPLAAAWLNSGTSYLQLRKNGPASSAFVNFTTKETFIAAPQLIINKPAPATTTTKKPVTTVKATTTTKKTSPTIKATTTTKPVTSTSTGTKVPSSIPSNCSAEAGDLLTAFFDKLPDNSTVVFPTNGCYLNNKFAIVDGKSNITIEGNNSTFKRTKISPPELSYPTPNPHLWIRRSTNVKVRNLNVQGTNTVSDTKSAPQLGSYTDTHAFEAAVRVEGVTNFSADHVTAKSVWGDGFQLQSGNGATVTASTITQNGRQAISITDQSNVLIDGVNIVSSRRAGIDIENNYVDAVSDNIQIRNSTIWSLLNAITAGGPGQANNVYIHHNTIKDSGVLVYDGRQDMSVAVRRHNWRIEYNTALSPYSGSGPAIIMSMTDNISIIGNTVPVVDYASRKVVSLRDTGGTLVVRNNFFNNAAASYEKEGTTGAVSACGNKLLSTGLFNQPLLCK